MKYADNIVKGFMTSLSIIVASIASAVWLGFVVTPLFVVGAVLVCASVYLYAQPAVVDKQLAAWSAPSGGASSDNISKTKE